MIVYCAENSTIIIDRQGYSTTFHLREWREGQQIKDARVELSLGQLDELIKILQEARISK